MKKDNFQPIVMPCTKEQYDSLISVLEKNNIMYDNYQGSFNGIVNNFTNYDNCVGKITNFNNTYFHTLRNRKYYQRFNRKIFLKSLGIVEEPEFVLPEKWCVRITEENAYILNEYLIRHLHKYKHSRKSWHVPTYKTDFEDNHYFHSETFETSYGNYGHSAYIIHSNFKEITFEQFKKYVLKQDTSILENQSVTNKQPKMKSTVNEIKQSEPRIKKGLLVVTQERVGIVTKYISDNNFDVTILHPSAHHGLIVTNLNHTVIRIFKGKLTLEQ